MLKESCQVPISYHENAHRLKFLRRATLGLGSRSALKHVKNMLKFQKLYGELEAAVHLTMKRELRWL